MARVCHKARERTWLSMRLSVDKINDKSPYWVIQLDDMQFRFKTKNGIIYRVGFYPDTFFMPGKAYHFYITNVGDERPPKDSNVFKVISLVLEEFFRHDTSVMLYICDPKDHRESIRAGLYKRWFDNYKQKDSLILRAVDIDFDGVIIYAGLIIRKDNPVCEPVLKSFDDFIRKAPSMYRVRPK